MAMTDFNLFHHFKSACDPRRNAPPRARNADAHLGIPLAHIQCRTALVHQLHAQPLPADAERRACGAPVPSRGGLGRSRSLTPALEAAIHDSRGRPSSTMLTYGLKLTTEATASTRTDPIILPPHPSSREEDSPIQTSTHSRFSSPTESGEAALGC